MTRPLSRWPPRSLQSPQQRRPPPRWPTKAATARPVRRSRLLLRRPRRSGWPAARPASLSLVERTEPCCGRGTRLPPHMLVPDLCHRRKQIPWAPATRSLQRSSSIAWMARHPACAWRPAADWVPSWPVPRAQHLNTMRQPLRAFSHATRRGASSPLRSSSPDRSSRRPPFERLCATRVARPPARGCSRFSVPHGRRRFFRV
mmetsp:Transcript_90320/g.271341  ORF Transcript_90320/g.271341 Transcript_90320/m.271341 type:complete len:202 (-) Transcript_90320:7-612(-)